MYIYILYGYIYMQRNDELSTQDVATSVWGDSGIDQGMRV